MCERSDTSTLVGANKALTLVRDAKFAHGKAEESAERFNHALEDRALEKRRKLKTKLEKLEYTYASQAGLHEANQVIEQADSDSNARLSEGHKIVFQEAIDALVTALTNAENSEDLAQQARV